MLINQWKVQEYPHALTTAPGLLVLQLERYRAHTPVTIPDVVQFPIFSQGVEVSWKSFQVRALVEHQGEGLLCGHYRAILRRQLQWWHTDDNRCAEPVTLTESLTRRLYLIWLTPARAAHDHPEPPHLEPAL